MFLDFGCLYRQGMYTERMQIQKGVQNENNFEDRHQNAPCLRSFSTCFFVYIQLSCILRFQNDRGRMVPSQYRNRIGQKPSVCPTVSCSLFWMLSFLGCQLYSDRETGTTQSVSVFYGRFFVKMYLPCLFSRVSDNQYKTGDHRCRSVESGGTLALFGRCGR